MILILQDFPARWDCHQKTSPVLHCYIKGRLNLKRNGDATSAKPKGVVCVGTPQERLEWELKYRKMS